MWNLEPPWQGIRLISSLTAGLLLCGVTSTLRATPPVEEDPRLARIAYSTLQNDPKLGEKNLSVRVLRGGKAILWGELPSKETLVLAEQVLMGIPGITAVECEGRIAAKRDPFLDKIDEAMKKAPSELARELAPIPDGAPLPKEVPIGIESPRIVTTVSKPEPADGSRPAPTAQLLEPRGPGETIDVRATVERMQRSDVRYARLRIELKKDRILLRHLSDDAAPAWELAKKIAEKFEDFVVVVAPQSR